MNAKNGSGLMSVIKCPSYHDVEQDGSCCFSTAPQKGRDWPLAAF